MTITEQVSNEAMARSYNRELARQVGTRETVVGPRSVFYSVPDHIRELAAKLAAEDAAEREREARRRLAVPSGLIATMREDWPSQSAAVEAFAKREDLKLGEAWALAIEAGVRALRSRR